MNNINHNPWMLATILLVIALFGIVFIMCLLQNEIGRSCK